MLFLVEFRYNSSGEKCILIKALNWIGFIESQHHQKLYNKDANNLQIFCKKMDLFVERPAITQQNIRRIIESWLEQNWDGNFNVR